MGSGGSGEALIPGLPDDLGSRILCMVPYAHHARLRPTCKAWMAILSAALPLRTRFPDHILCIFPEDPSQSPPLLFDPKNLAWASLPRAPCSPHVYALSNFASVALGPDLFVLGGSLFDTRSFPLDRPSSTAAALRFSFLTSRWASVPPMISPRGSFACAAFPSLGQILVAGGGSRHALFAAAGNRLASAERFHLLEGRWEAVEALPRYRAGCVGLAVGEKDFWVMGGYGGSRTISGVFPVDDYYRDAVVMDVRGDPEWREVGDMWSDGERSRLGKVAVVEDESVFMLDDYNIFRYDKALNLWQKESTVPKKPFFKSSNGFAGLDGELYVLTMLKGGNPIEPQRSRQQKRASLLVQIYNPRKKTWRSLLSKTPLPDSLDFKTAVICTVRL